MSVRQILDAFGTKLKEDLQREIDAAIKANAEKNGGDFGGNSRLANSVRFYYTTDGEDSTFNLAMAQYWEAFNAGRRKGAKQPPSDALLPWLKKRGFKVELSNRKKNEIKATKDKLTRKTIKSQSRDKKLKAMAFVISRSIKIKGITGNHFFDKIINDGRMEKLRADLGKNLKSDVIVNFEKV